MIEEAWNEYRGWAKRARALQTSSRRWSRAALVCVGLVAIFGAAASQTTGGSISGRTLAFLAAALAAITPILGREILSVDSEARWVRARATAEAIKSECFRFAAGLGDYAGSSARSALIAKCNILTEGRSVPGLRRCPIRFRAAAMPAVRRFRARRHGTSSTAWTSRCGITLMVRRKMNGVSDYIVLPASPRP